jgi:putative copper resistance protein D
MTSTPTDTGRSRVAVPSLLLGYAVAAGAVAVYSALTVLSPATLSPPTPTAVAEPLGGFTAALAGAVCLGGLVLVLVTARPDERGVLDPAAFRAHLVVERAAPVWAITALFMVVVQAAADAGVPATRLLTSGKLGAALGASETGRAWVAVTVFATVLAITSRLTVRWEWHVPLLIPALLGVVAVPVTGNAGQGPDHDYTTSAVIVFAVAVTVWAGTTIVNAALPHHPGGDRRAGLTAVAAASVALLYGLLLLGLRAGTSGLASRYGLLGIIVGAALAVGFAAGLVGLRRARGIPALAVAGVAMGALAALSLMAIQTAPRLLASPPSIWDVLLGYQLPGAPTPMRLATFWRFDPFLGALGLALAGAYLFGVMRLRRRGDAWPVGRTVAWLTGCAFLVIATGSGVRSYGSAMFSVHMAEHMMLNMFVPLYVVYFTPLFDTLVRYHWGHEFMSVHFLITGYLFYWGIIGVDPGPRRLPFIGRLALLFAIMPFHAFFGVAMMSMTTAVGGNFYRGLALPWVPNLNDDQHLGGAIAWGASEVPVIIVVIALITQWARQDRRTSVRSDRHADAGYDDDLDAYNNMLRELARQRTSK